MATNLTHGSLPFDASAELERARERLQLALEASGVSTWETDLRGGVVQLSEGWAKSAPEEGATFWFSLPR